MAFTGLVLKSLPKNYLFKYLLIFENRAFRTENMGSEAYDNVFALHYIRRAFGLKRLGLRRWESFLRISLSFRPKRCKSILKMLAFRSFRAKRRGIIAELHQNGIAAVVRNRGRTAAKQLKGKRIEFWQDRPPAHTQFCGYLQSMDRGPISALTLYLLAK